MSLDFADFSVVGLIVVGLVLLFVIGMAAINEWRDLRSKGSREVKVARSRGPSIVQTPWGFYYVVASTKYSEDEVHLVCMDRQRRKHEFNAFAHEIREANIFQAMNGPGNAMYIYTPGADARQRAEQQYRTIRNTAVMHQAKLDAERATTNEKLANANIKQQVYEQVQHINEGARARTPPQNKK